MTTWPSLNDATLFRGIWFYDCFYRLNVLQNHQIKIWLHVWLATYFYFKLSKHPVNFTYRSIAMEIHTIRRVSSTVSLIELETAISREKNKTDDKIISVCQLFWISHQKKKIWKTNKKESFMKQLSFEKSTIVTIQKNT